MQESFTFPEPDEPERWLPVVGYEGLYEVSDLGRVRSFHRHGRGKRGGLRHLPSTRHGYLNVGLSRDGKGTTRLVHHLVLEAFVGPCPPGMEACHGPGGTGDASLANLCWGTKAKNMADKVRDGTLLYGNRHPLAKLTEAQVTEMRERYAAGETQPVLAREFGVVAPVVSMIVRGKSWSRIPSTVDVPEYGYTGETHFHAKLNWELVTEIRRRYAAGENQRALAAEFGVRQSTLWAVTSGKNWKNPPAA